MAEDYDDVVARQPGGRLTKMDIQRARYGAKLDERRHQSYEAFLRWTKIVTSIGAAAAVIGAALRLLNVHI